MRLQDVFHVLRVFHQVRGRTWFPVGVSSKDLNRKTSFLPPNIYTVYIYINTYIDHHTSRKTSLANSPEKMDFVASDDSFP